MKIDKSSENTDALAFGLDGIEDVRNGPDEVPEELHYGFPMRNFNLIESYQKAEIYLAFRIVLNRETTQFDLIIGAVPDGADGYRDGLGSCAEWKPGTKDQSPTSYPEKRMFIGIVNCVESPEKVVPSSVWLERSKERSDFFRELFGPAFQASFEILGAARKRESALTEVRPVDAAGNSHGVTRIIKSGSEMVGGFNREMPDDVWQRFDESEFVKFLAGAIRIRLYDKAVWFGCEESARFDFDISNVFVCASNL